MSSLSPSPMTKRFLTATSASALALFLSACGNNDKGETGSAAQSPAGSPSIPSPITKTDATLEGNRQLGANEQSVEDTQKRSYLALAYNSYVADTDKYKDPKDLITDLSVMSPENLYLIQQYKAALEQKAAHSYTGVKLPSGATIDTGNTVLSPELALARNKAEAVMPFAAKTRPKEDNPVLLSAPSSTRDTPETPVIPANAEFTAVLFEPSAKSHTQQTIVSIEQSDAQIPRFGGFVHYDGGAPIFRYFDSKSTVDTTNPAFPLLSASAEPAGIQARFVHLTGDMDTQGGGSGKGLNIESLTRNEFSKLGLSTEDLYALLAAPLNKKLLEFTSDSGRTALTFRRYFASELGIIALGGKSTYGIVALVDQSYLYPMSETGTTVTQLTADKTSGIIAETGKSVSIDKLEGAEELKVLLVTGSTPPSATMPIVHVKDLQKVTKFIVRVGRVAPNADLTKLKGMTLLSHDNKVNGGITAVPENTDGHQDGKLYNLSVGYDDQKLTVKSLTVSANTLAAGVVKSALDHHPDTQGISTADYQQIADKLNPATHLNRTHTNIVASAGLSHLNASILGTSSQQGQFSHKLGNGLAITGSSNSQAHGLSTSLHKGPALFSAYGNIDKSGTNSSVGANVAIASSTHISGVTFTPALCVGYALDTLPNANLSAKNIIFNLSDMKVSSAYAQALLAGVNHAYADLKLSGAVGLDVRHSRFANGQLRAIHGDFALNGESSTTTTVFLEGAITTQSSEMTARIMNFNTFEILFSLIN